VPTLTTGDATVTAVTAGELPGEHRAGVVHALRATTAAPWYMEELVVDKELGLGKVAVAGVDGGEGGGHAAAAAAAAAAGAAAAAAAASTGAAASNDRGGRGGGGGVGGGGAGEGRGERGGSNGNGSGGDGCGGGGGGGGSGESDGDDGGSGGNDDSEHEDTAAAMAEAAAAAASLGAATTDPAEASRVAATLRFIDGAIACNNPTAVGIFEARRLFPRHRPLCVVSLGTGAAVPREVPPGIGGASWVQNVVSATCDVVQVDATVRHVLGAVGLCTLNQVDP
jgi:hypothetical protein